MRARPLVLYLSLVAFGVAAGFFVASRVMAGGNGPGSAADPLVARSYVDEQVATYIAGLQQRVSDLTAREAQLEQALAEVQKQQGITPIQPAQAAAPKQLYIKTGNSYVNLRQGPGTSYPLVGTATRGNPDSEPMTVLAESGGWYQVRLPDSRTGWVAGWLVEERS
ncbi:MAG: SH3 domain-containing protein [Thermacetogeniaceae bacterium]